MLSREEIIEELSFVRDYLEARAIMCTPGGKGKARLLQMRNACEGAAELLKAQAARVMTPEEVQSLPEEAVVWFEELDNGGRTYIQPMISNGKAFMIGTHLDINVSSGAINWTGRRFWTAYPTEAQRETTPWQK